MENTINIKSWLCAEYSKKHIDIQTKEECKIQLISKVDSIYIIPTRIYQFKRRKSINDSQDQKLTPHILFQQQYTNYNSRRVQNTVNMKSYIYKDYSNKNMPIPTKEE